MKPELDWLDRDIVHHSFRECVFMQKVKTKIRMDDFYIFIISIFATEMDKITYIGKRKIFEKIKIFLNRMKKKNYSKIAISTLYYCYFRFV